MELREGFYRALQRGVDVFGGHSALADAMGTSLSDTHVRVMRKEDSKGNLQRAFYDFTYHMAVSDDAAARWLTDICEVLGYEPPVRKRVVSDDEIGRASIAWLRSLPPSMREAARADIAASLGIKPEALKL